MQNGYYYAVVKEVSVECYDPPSNTQQSGSKAYYYTSTEGLEEDVAIGNNNTILGSFLASGEEPDYDPSASATGSQPTQTQMPETVPGISGGGAQQIGGADDSASASGAPGSAPTGGSSFSQGGGMSDASTVVASSAVALLGFFIAALML